LKTYRPLVKKIKDAQKDRQKTQFTLYALREENLEARKRLTHNAREYLAIGENLHQLMKDLRPQVILPFQDTSLDSSFYVYDILRKKTLRLEDIIKQSFFFFKGPFPSRSLVITMKSSDKRKLFFSDSELIFSLATVLFEEIVRHSPMEPIRIVCSLKEGKLVMMFEKVPISVDYSGLPQTSLFSIQPLRGGGNIKVRLEPLVLQDSQKVTSHKLSSPFPHNVVSIFPD
jgi:hypothetical protein